MVHLAKCVCDYICTYYVHTYNKFTVAPNPVNASSIEVLTIDDDIKVIWKVRTYVCK